MANQIGSHDHSTFGWSSTKSSHILQCKIKEQGKKQHGHVFSHKNPAVSVLKIGTGNTENLMDRIPSWLEISGFKSKTRVKEVHG